MPESLSRTSVIPVEVSVGHVPIRLVDMHVDYVIASTGSPPPLLSDEYASVQLVHLILIGFLIVLVLDLIHSYLLSVILFLDVLIALLVLVLLLILIVLVIHDLHLMHHLLIVLIITVSLSSRDLLVILVVLSGLILDAGRTHELVSDDLHVLVLL